MTLDFFSIITGHSGGIAVTHLDTDTWTHIVHTVWEPHKIFVSEFTLCRRENAVGDCTRWRGFVLLPSIRVEFSIPREA